MKASYRGYEIDAHRGESIGGDDYLYFTVMRESDGRFVVDDFTTGVDTEEDYIGYMKERIDSELADPDPWGEKAEERTWG